MKLLLDTHVLLWFCTGNEQLSDKARELIADKSNKIYYSVLFVMEVEIKHIAHPDRISMDGERLDNHCHRLEFTQLPLDVEHILEIKKLTRKENTPPHRVTRSIGSCFVRRLSKTCFSLRTTHESPNTSRPWF